MNPPAMMTAETLPTVRMSGVNRGPLSPSD
jgi:hypothetical protein